MKKRPSFLIVVGVFLLAILLVFIVLKITMPNSHRYKSSITVGTTGYTNALVRRSFEEHMIETIPGVLRLRTVPNLGLGPVMGGRGPTNGVLIEIVTVGATPEDAVGAANDAAIGFRTHVMTNYGIKGFVIVPASEAREFSYFHDTLQPAITRMLDQ